MFKRKDPAFAAERVAERILRLQLRLTLTNGTSVTALRTGDVSRAVSILGSVHIDCDLPMSRPCSYHEIGDGNGRPGQGSWKTASGPYVDDATYNGERYDARLEHAAWDTADFDDDGRDEEKLAPGAAAAAAAGARKWEAAVPTQGPAGRMSVWSAPAVLEDQAIKPVNITEISSAISSAPPPSSSSSKVYVGEPASTSLSLSEIRIRPPRLAPISIRLHQRDTMSSECEAPAFGAPPPPDAARRRRVVLGCAGMAVDFGVNVAGVCRLRNIHVSAGAAITLRHGEILQHRGLPDLNGTVDPRRIYVGNLRGARATDV
jgi:hypothetical protein